MNKILLLSVLVVSLATRANAVVIRHDVDDSQYRTETAPAAMVDMPHQGHGMLIAPHWVVTAAHVVFYDYRGKTISMGGREYVIEHVIFHSGYAKPEEGLFSGDSARSQAYLQNNHDIALLKLKEPVSNTKPIPLYMENDESGRTITFYGKGNSGNGLSGEKEKSRGTLRRAENRIISAEDQWIAYHFDQGKNALPLEGMQGSGDSGGPAFITSDGVDYLAGLASWDVYQGDLADFKAGAYGLGGKLVRLSYYRDWIADVQTWHEDKLKRFHNKIGPYTD